MLFDFGFLLVWFPFLGTMSRARSPDLTGILANRPHKRGKQGRELDSVA